MSTNQRVVRVRTLRTPSPEVAAAAQGRANGRPYRPRTAFDEWRLGIEPPLKAPEPQPQGFGAVIVRKLLGSRP